MKVEKNYLGTRRGAYTVFSGILIQVDLKFRPTRATPVFIDVKLICHQTLILTPFCDGRATQCSFPQIRTSCLIFKHTSATRACLLDTLNMKYRTPSHLQQTTR